MAQARDLSGSPAQRKATFRMVAGLLVSVIVFLRIYRLDSMPGDVYGDIIIILNYVKKILEGQWPFTFNLSTGPLYHYLITPIVLLFGFNYLAIKVASVVTSLGVLYVTYMLALALGFGRWTAMLSAGLAGVSSWLLVYSRLGNSQILTPLLSGLAFYFLIRYVEAGRKGGDLAAASLSAALGLYSYPQTFFIAPAVGAVLFWQWRRGRIAGRGLGTYLLLTAIGAVPFAVVVAKEAGDFFQGYIGGKLVGGDVMAGLGNLPHNVLASLLMLHVRGSAIFRGNPQSLPQLDVLSGLFFLVGLVYLVRREQRHWLPYTFWPYLFLQLPGILVLRYPGQVPSASRALLITPFVYVIAGLGMRWALTWLHTDWLRGLAIVAAGTVILWQNSYRYFDLYINGLPNHNVSFARHIAAVIDQTPADVQVTVLGCCWGQWSQPLADGIAYSLAHPRPVNYEAGETFTCPPPGQRPQKALFILDPRNRSLAAAISACFPGALVASPASAWGDLMFTAIAAGIGPPPT